MSNPNNPNTGGCAEPELAKHVPAKVTLASPDNQPTVTPFGGRTFEPGSPAGREANPRPKVDGGNPILT